MGSTITEKILARAAGRDEVHAGDIIEAKVDLALANDITAPLAIAEFEKAGFTKVWDPARIALVPDHFTPNKDIKAAGQSKKMREFARKHKHRQLLRGRARRHRARPAARHRHGGAGRRRRRRRQPHVHLRRRGRLQHRHGQHRLRRRDGLGPHLAARAGEHQVRLLRPPAAVGDRQGPDPAHHRPDRRRRRPLPGDGVHRRGHRGAFHGRALHHVQHGHRGRRQERHRRLRRRRRRSSCSPGPRAAARGPPARSSPATPTPRTRGSSRSTSPPCRSRSASRTCRATLLRRPS